MSHPRLSICIATLNRAAFLGATLESILSQSRDGLEIVIVDGASTDGTTELVQSVQRLHGNIRYERLGAKGGVDQDYCRAVELAAGEYCWLFTDDDILQPGAIDAVWRELDRGYELIVVNADVRDAELARVLEPRCLATTDNVEYVADDFERIFRDTASFMSFIGCVIVKRQLWLSRDTASYFGTVFVHVGAIFQAPLPGRALVIGHPHISIRYGNALWTSKSFEISMFKWPQLIWSFTHFSEAARHAVSAREPWRTRTALLVYRARGAYSIADYRRLLRERLNSPAERFYARVVASVPGCPLNALLVCYLTFLGKQRPTAELRLVDLRSSHTYYRRCVSRLLGKA